MSSGLLGLLAGGGPPAAAAQEEAGFGGQLQGLLTSPALGLAAGLLSAAGPSRRPISLGEGLSSGLQLASGLQQARLENEATRQALTARARQREARQGLLGQLQQGGGLEDPETLGLLAEAEPELFAQGLLGQIFPQPRREPSLVQSLRAAGIDPASPEGRDLIVESIQSRGGGDELLERVQSELALLQLQEKRREREREETTEEKQRTGLRQGIRRNLGDVRELAKLNRELMGTFLEAGLPASNLRRMTAGAFNAALAAAGADRSEQQKQLAKFDKFRKGLNDLIINTIDRFGSSITNQQLQLLQNASASPDISPAAVASILANVAEINLDTADREGIELENREELESFIERERAFSPVGEEPQGGNAGASGASEPTRAPGLPERPTVKALQRRPELDVQLDAEGNHFLVNTETGDERRLRPRDLRALGLLSGER